MASCIFCQIVNKQSETTTIEHETENVCVFKDISPASEFHYLAVTKTHIHDPKCLTIDNKELVEEMQEALKTVLEKVSDLKPEESLYGFHWPPFNSVKHLHMHGIYPKSKMGFFKGFIFKSDSMWFKSTDYVLNNLFLNKT